MCRDGTATGDRILDAAEHLVIENGFAATSVDQVLEAAGTSKGAFFHHFDSKRDLGRALVERYVAADLAHLHGALAATAGDRRPGRARAGLRPASSRTPADELMSAAVRLPLHLGAHRATATHDTGDRSGARSWPGGGDTRTPACRAADGAVGPPVDVDALADHLFVTFEGAFLLCRSTGDPHHMRRQLNTHRTLVEALLNQ